MDIKKIIAITLTGFFIIAIFIFLFFSNVKKIEAETVGIKLDKNIFIVNETLRGNLVFIIREGEIYPSQSVLEISLNGYKINTTLENLIKLTNTNLTEFYNTYYSHSYPQLNKLNESGFGYGIIGKKKIDKFYVYLKFKKIENKEEEKRIENIEEKKEIEEEITNNKIEIGKNIEEKVEKNLAETNEVAFSEKKEEIEIKIEIKIGEIINYKWDENYEVEVIKVTDEKDNEFDKKLVKIYKDIENKRIKIEIEEKIIEKGFGEEFLGETYIFTFPIENFNITLNNLGVYEFHVKFYYKNIIFSDKKIKIKVISYEEYQEIINISNVTKELTNFTTIKIYDKNGNLIKEITANSENVILKVLKNDIIIEYINISENINKESVNTSKKSLSFNDYKIISSELPVTEIKAKKLPPTLKIQIGKPNEKQIREGLKTEVLAIQPDIEIEYATITLEKYGEVNAIMACKNWSIEDFKCHGEWNLKTLNFIDNGTHISFNITNFSGITGGIWAYPEWPYRRPIEVSIPENVIDFQINLNISYDENMQIDFDDIRFADIEGNHLNYWIEQKIDGEYAYIWVKGNFTNLNEIQLYVYYGNDNVSSESDIKAVTEFYDDFESCDGSNWDAIINIGNSDEGSYDFNGAYEGNCGFRIIDGSGKTVSAYSTMKYSSLNRWYAKVYINTYPIINDYYHHDAGILLGKDSRDYYYFAGIINYGSTNDPRIAIWKNKIDESLEIIDSKPISNWPKNTWFYLIVKKSEFNIMVELYYLNGTLYDYADFKFSYPEEFTELFGVEGKMGSAQQGYIMADYFYLMKYLPFNISVGEEEVLGCINITIPGYYKLVQNISSNGTCLNIYSSHVIIDCDNHSITYGINIEGKGIFIDSYLNNITIKNCIFIDGNENLNNYGIYGITKINNLKIYNNIFNQTNNYGGRNSKAIYILDSNFSIFNNTFYLYWISATPYWHYTSMLVIGDYNFRDNKDSKYFSNIFNNKFYYYNLGNGVNSIVSFGIVNFYNNYIEDVLNSYGSLCFSTSYSDPFRIYNNTCKVHTGISIYCAFQGRIYEIFNNNITTFWTTNIFSGNCKQENIKIYNNYFDTKGFYIELNEGAKNISFENNIINFTINSKNAYAFMIIFNDNVIYIQNISFKNNTIYIQEASNLLTINSKTNTSFENFSFIDNKILCLSSYCNASIYLYNNSNISFINTTIVNRNNIFVYDNASFYVYWHLNIKVKNKQNNSVSRANVTLYNKNNEIVFSNLTNSAGEIEIKNILDFLQNSSNREEKNNHTIVIDGGTPYKIKVIVKNITQSEHLTIILNIPPTAPQLYLPNNGEHTYNRKPTFIWNQSYDMDGDKISYVLIINCVYNGTCTNPPCLCNPFDNRTIENITTTNYTLTSNLKNFWDTYEYYIWGVGAYDGEDYNYSFTRDLFIDTLVSINISNNQINFGYMNLNEENDTTDNNPMPLIIENNGNCFINLEFSATPLWQTSSFPSSYYQFKADFHEYGSFNLSNSTINWENVNNFNWLIGQLNYSNISNEGEMEIKIKVPPYEPPGLKSSIINLFASFVDVIE